jgi:hypothetical protein
MKNLSETPKITANHSARTLTIRKNGSTYRTNKLSKEEFEYYSRHATTNDINNFLINSGEYYVVR